MHEMSIAEELLDQAEETARANSAELTSLTIGVGQLSSVIIPSLEMCLEALLDDRGLNDVRTDISAIPARAECECGHHYSPDSLYGECPECGSFEKEITDGKRVVLESIEVDDGQD